MFSRAKAVYLKTRKRHDLLFNAYLMRPLAAPLVSLVHPTGVTPNQLTLCSVGLFAVAAALLVVLPLVPDFSVFGGGLIAIGVLELSYLFDCADGMLARYRKTASKQGHLFDFFTDEIKAVMLVGALAVRLWLTGGYAPTGKWLRPELTTARDDGFLFAGIAGVAVVASAISLTNFVRRPEISGKETPVEAHYETVERDEKTSLAGRLGALVFAFLRLLVHYPSHIWIFALCGRLDLFFWLYVVVNGLYLGRGWLGLLVRFGRG